MIIKGPEVEKKLQWLLTFGVADPLETLMRIKDFLPKKVHTNFSL